MRLPRPRSLSGLLLIGFTIAAAPLLVGIVNAAMQMNRLSNRSEQLVKHGMDGTRNNQRMFEEIGALERTARLPATWSPPLMRMEKTDWGVSSFRNP